MSDQEIPGGAEQPQPSNVMNSITMAFNLGVSANQQTAGTKSVAVVAGDLAMNIYNNLAEIYGTQHDEALLQANTEYFLQIALLGYIVPSICAYDEDFKNRLFALIEAKANAMPTEGGAPPGSPIVTP